MRPPGVSSGISNKPWGCSSQVSHLWCRSTDSRCLRCRYRNILGSGPAQRTAHNSNFNKDMNRFIPRYYPIYNEKNNNYNTSRVHPSVTNHFGVNTSSQFLTFLPIFEEVNFYFATVVLQTNLRETIGDRREEKRWRNGIFSHLEFIVLST